MKNRNGSPSSNHGSGGRRRPAAQITLGRAARLHRLVMALAQRPRGSEELLTDLGVGLRTFYREMQLIKKCGIKIARKAHAYTLNMTAEQAEGRLPFPDPQLSFAEMAELARCPGVAATRLAEILQRVTTHDQPARKPRKARRGRTSTAAPALHDAP